MNGHEDRERQGERPWKRQGKRQGKRNPAGLVKVPRAGTKNGAFISWIDPLTNAEMFRWDENPNYPNGPHYHINNPIYKKDKVHFYPGDGVPDPYATIYFPLG